MFKVSAVILPCYYSRINQPVPINSDNIMLALLVPKQAHLLMQEMSVKHTNVCGNFA